MASGRRLGAPETALPVSITVKMHRSSGVTATNDGASRHIDVAHPR
jgi:hypothetical protein